MAHQIPTSFVLFVLALISLFLKNTEARDKCFSTFPKPDVEQWTKEKHAARNSLNDLDEFLRCFLLSFDDVVTKRHPDFKLTDVHFLSREEVVESLREEEEEEKDDRKQAEEGTDRRTLQQELQLPYDYLDTLAARRRKKKKKKNDEEEEEGDLGGACNSVCPPEPLSGNGGTNVKGGGEFPAFPGSRQLFRGSGSQNDEMAEAYTDLIAEKMTTCIAISKERHNLFRDFLEGDDKKIQVMTCRMAQKKREEQKEKDALGSQD